MKRFLLFIALASWCSLWLGGEQSRYLAIVGCYQSGRDMGR